MLACVKLSSPLAPSVHIRYVSPRSSPRRISRLLIFADRKSIHTAVIRRVRTETVTIVPSSSPRFVSASIRPQFYFVHPFLQKNWKLSFLTILRFSITKKHPSKRDFPRFLDVKNRLFKIFLSIILCQKSARLCFSTISDLLFL